MESCILQLRLIRFNIYW